MRKAVTAAVLVCLSGPVAGMTIREAGPPVGLPPEGFDGIQFVDQRGCLYIRTGTKVRPDWVPRVKRTGEVICGLEPSFPLSSDGGATAADDG